MFIYFLCTGNSCRSQIAEGFARLMAKDGVRVESAGIEAHGLNPRAVQVMQEVGIDISTHHSKLIDNQLLHQADFAITLCGDARDRCPITPPEVTRLHWGFEDPARAEGTEEEIMAVFRRVRDGIRDQVKAFLAEQNLLREDL
ncbi:arsenate reductase (thioredoxin) [Sulfobacillus thermosulfidooxidans]|uniref:arsenate reductase (thioredoxin) n=1 Tax=Sulfobacillus thermosulfidooxidans TaxID=28034 RepID=UPI00096BC095|nr:arsenate reductase (thioredoxin) [Sulfobacillus thermosulfidooxidans]OLZ09011.1 arsenate reductase (thioredoxin) [Sulfobacillus thermosulfidooxidans]OLZ14197.1 arsenate reductase (thioredoxin) [Sulfobacillus thermosulfidooxidans]OLZ18940.1 arsenate reductase (thioredoxin) [Sulfobacillus thermosulfidooxidans]